MIYNEKNILEIYNNNIIEAKNKLKELSFYCQKEVKFKGLTGWVFEQTIQKCISEEFMQLNNDYIIDEQFKLSNLSEKKKSRGEVDLIINNENRNVLIEIKYSGFYNRNSETTYQKYFNIINEYNLNNENKYYYIFLSGKESYYRYKGISKKVFGENNVFYLDEKNSWKMFTDKIVKLLG